MTNPPRIPPYAVTSAEYRADGCCKVWLAKRPGVGIDAIENNVRKAGYTLRGVGYNTARGYFLVVRSEDLQTGPTCVILEAQSNGRRKPIVNT